MRRKYNNNNFAMVLIVIGVILVLSNLGLPLFENISFGTIIGLIWPFLLISPGLKNLRNGQRSSGILLTSLGFVFLLDNLLALFGIDFKVSSLFKFIFPALLIYTGYHLLKNSQSGEKSRPNFSQSTADTHENDQGSYTISFNAKDFHYTSANTPSGISKLNLNISFGGAEIYVEEGIQVILVGQYFLGGHEFFGSTSGGIKSNIKEARYEEDSEFYDRTIIINANITIGGLEITGV